MTKDELKHRLILAVEKYSAAFDGSINKRQKRKLHDEARSIITNDIIAKLDMGEWMYGGTQENTERR